jgi:hypothetical protein
MTSTINEVVVFLSRWTELSVPGKATILLTLGLVAAHFAVRSRAAVRHIILAATFAALASLPAIAVAGLRLPVAVVVSRGGVSVPAASSATSFGPAQGVFGNNSVPRPAAGSESNIPRWLTIVRFLWIAGSVIFALPLAVDLWRLRRLRRDWLPWPELRQPALALAAERGVRRRVEVLLHEEIPAPLPAAFGIRRSLFHGTLRIGKKLSFAARWFTNWNTSGAATGRCIWPPAPHARSTGFIRWSGWRGGGCASKPSVPAMMP